MYTKDDKKTYFANYDEILYESKVMHAHFAEAKIEFTAYDTIFDDPFGSNWFAQIKQCMKTKNEVPSENIIQSVIRMKIEECRQAHSDLRYFVVTAFPHRDDIFSYFGFDDYSEARREPSKMIKLLGRLYKNSLEFADELIKAGYTRTAIYRLKTLQEELIKTEYEHRINKHKMENALCECFDICYAYMRLISKSGKIIFAENPIKYQFYLLPSERKSKDDILRKIRKIKYLPYIAIVF